MEETFASEVLPLGPSNSDVSKRLQPIHIFFDEEPVFSDSEDEAEWANHIISVQPNTSSLQIPYSNAEKEVTNDKEPTLVLNEVLRLCCKNCSCCKKIEEYLGTLQSSGTLLKSPSSLASEDSGFVTSNSNHLGKKCSTPNEEAMSSKINVISCEILAPQKVPENSTVDQKRYSLREKNKKVNPPNTNIEKNYTQNILGKSLKNRKKEVTEISKRSYQNIARPKRVTKKPTQLSNRRRILRPSVILNIPKFSENSPIDGEDSSSSLSDPFAEDEKCHQNTENMWHYDLEKRNTDSQEFVQNETKKSTVRHKKRLMSNKERTKLVDLSAKDNENITSDAHSDTDEDIIGPRKWINLTEKRKEPEYSRRRSEPSNVKRRYTDRRLSNIPIDTTAHGTLDKALSRKLARTGGLFSSHDSKNGKDESFRSCQIAKSKVRKLYSSDEWLSSQEFLSQFENA